MSENNKKNEEIKVSDLINEAQYFMKFNTTGETFNENNDIDDEDVEDKKALCGDSERQEKAERVYSSYVKAWNNAVDLITEVELLFENGHYARALALAIISYEEIGKSQIAADYYIGLLDNETYQEAFRDHCAKISFAGRHKAINVKNGTKPPFKVDRGFVLNEKASEELEKRRQDCFYVGKDNEPSDDIDKEEVSKIINSVKERIDHIKYAEWLNDRIGSKALFK